MEPHRNFRVILQYYYLFEKQHFALISFEIEGQFSAKNAHFTRYF